MGNVNLLTAIAVDLEHVGHADVVVIAVAHNLEGVGAVVEVILLKAADADVVHARGGVLGDHNVVVTLCATNK